MPEYLQLPTNSEPIVENSILYNHIVAVYTVSQQVKDVVKCQKRRDYTKIIIK